MQSHSKKMTVVSVKRLLQDLGGHQPWGQVSSKKGWDVDRPSWWWGCGGSWDVIQVSITVCFPTLCT